MSGTKQFGFLEESAEGTSLIDANSVVVNFGLQDDYDRPHPWADQDIGGILQEGGKAFVDLVPGMKSVNIKHQFVYQHAWEWYYLLGKGAHISATEDDFTLGTLAANPIKSRTAYSRVGTDYVKATGCKTSSFAIHLENPGPNKEPKPIWCDLELWGWTTSSSLALNNAPTYPANLGNPQSKGVEQMVLCKIDAGGTDDLVSLANLQEITIGIKNTLNYHGGILSTTPRGIEQMEGTKVFITGLATMDFTTNDMLTRGRYDFNNEWAPGTTHSFEFKVKFNAGATQYHDICLENVRIHALKPTVYKKKIEAYTFAGEAMKYSSTEPITVKCIDGQDYIPA